jgi:hypothetical protein
VIKAKIQKYRYLTNSFISFPCTIEGTYYFKGWANRFTTDSDEYPEFLCERIDIDGDTLDPFDHFVLSFKNYNHSTREHF